MKTCLISKLSRLLWMKVATNRWFILIKASASRLKQFLNQINQNWHLKLYHRLCENM